ncbi:MAG: SxtJ family membrane protein, partial [Planctomycetaceae bacterium]
MAIVDINWNPTRKDLRWFAGLLIPFCGAVAWSIGEGDLSQPGPMGIVAAGLAIGITGLVSPDGIRYLYLAWMVAVSPIAFVMSSVIVGFVFYVVVLPLGLLMKLSRRDALQRRREAGTES